MLPRPSRGNVAPWDLLTCSGAPVCYLCVELCHCAALSSRWHLPPILLLQRKRLEPFEVPTSGVFWLHDDRFAAEGDAEAGGMRSDAVEAEQDERQK